MGLWNVVGAQEAMKLVEDVVNDQEVQSLIRTTEDVKKIG